MPMALPERMAETLRKYDMLAKGRRILVAFSGGSDSLALLCAFLAIKEEWALEIAAAHLDHGLRGDKAKADADWAEAFCRDKGLAFFRGYWPGLQEAKDGRSPEEAAREARRRFLEATLKEWPGDLIALGHHLDDQAETVLIRLLNGAGLRGMGGIWPMNGRYIRPLLEMDRQEILDYVEKLGIEARYDETNEDVAYLRNRLRGQVMPILKGCNPGFAAAVGRMTELVRREDAFLDGLAGEALAGLRTAVTGPEREKLSALYKLADMEQRALDQPKIALAGLAGLDPVLARRALRLWIAEETGVALDMAGVERIHRLAIDGRTGATAEAGGGLRVRKDKGCLAAARESAPPGRDEAEAKERPIRPGETIQLPGGARIRAGQPGDAEGAAAFDRYVSAWAGEGAWPVIRRRRAGDWLAMPYGRKKLKEMFQEKGIPRELRDYLPVLAVGAQVIWVPGVVGALSPGAPCPSNPIEFACLIS